MRQYIQKWVEPSQVKPSRYKWKRVTTWLLPEFWCFWIKIPPPKKQQQPKSNLIYFNILSILAFLRTFCLYLSTAVLMCYQTFPLTFKKAAVDWYTVELPLGFCLYHSKLHIYHKHWPPLHHNNKTPTLLSGTGIILVSCMT